MLTRVFKSGNSLAVRIPKELAIVEASQEVEIERVGQSLVIRPVVRETLADLPAIFASFSDGMRRWQREPNEQKERDWSGWWGSTASAPATELQVHDPGPAVHQPASGIEGGAIEAAGSSSLSQETDRRRGKPEGEGTV
jgi:antitoxin VapB